MITEKYRLNATLPRRAPVAIWSLAAVMLFGMNLLSPKSFPDSPVALRLLLMNREKSSESMESEKYEVKDYGENMM